MAGGGGAFENVMTFLMAHVRNVDRSQWIACQHQERFARF